MGLAVGGGFPPIFVGIAEDEIEGEKRGREPFLRAASNSTPVVELESGASPRP